MIDAFKKYKSAGFATLPTTADKSPAVPKGESWLGGWLNPSEYEKSHGIGILCGKLSGGLECIDFDNHFSDAEDILDKFLHDPETADIFLKHKFPLEKTVRGGFHLIYRCDTVEGSLKLASRMNGKQVPDTIIETRGENAYFCCDPTPGYKFISNDLTGDILNPPVITSEERRTLLNAARSLNEVIKPVKKIEFEETDRPGDIYNKSPEAAEEFKSELKSAGWTELSGDRWRRPGKDKGISATFGFKAPGIFHVFTANGHPFEPEHAYTPFQGVGLLKYGGDFKRFAKELYEKRAPVAKVMDYESYKIDPLSDLTEPPVYCSIGGSPAMTAGNFSLLNGKAKSGKTFFLGSLIASMLDNVGQLNTIQGSLPSGKRKILYFDTEQSHYHATRTIKRICSLTRDPNPSNLIAYSFRPFTPAERLSFIEDKISKTPDLGAVAIDGIRDLLTIGINDEAEATSLTSKFLKWTSEYNIHLILILHQNKNDLNARGHIGTECLNKAETTISISKDKSDIFIVSCEYSRDISFDDFAFTIEEGLPVAANIPTEGQKKTLDPQAISDENHIQTLNLIFKEARKLTGADLQAAIQYHFHIGVIKSRDFVYHYILKNWIVKEREGKNIYYAYKRAIF